MSSLFGEISRLDFEPESQRFYDHTRLASEVILPLTKHYSPVNWRQCAGSDSLGIQVRGSMGGTQFDAILAVYNVFPDEDSPHYTTAFALKIEEIVHDTRQEMIRGLAEIALSGIETEKVNDLSFKVGTAYVFSLHGDISIEASQSVEDHRGEVLWATFANEESEVISGGINSLMIREHDMEKLENGIHILRAPDAIKQALAIIKAEPIV